MEIISIKNDVLGKSIATARLNMGISQFELGKLVGVDRKTISTYERGTRRIHGVTLLKVAKVLNLSLDQLIDIKEEPVDGRTRQARTLKELDKVEALPKAEQKMIFTLIDSLASKHTHAE